jgi:hypothetical protein
LRNAIKYRFADSAPEYKAPNSFRIGVLPIFLKSVAKFKGNYYGRDRNVAHACFRPINFLSIRRFRLRGKWLPDHAACFHKPPCNPGRPDLPGSHVGNNREWDLGNRFLLTIFFPE